MPRSKYKKEFDDHCDQLEKVYKKLSQQQVHIQSYLSTQQKFFRTIDEGNLASTPLADAWLQATNKLRSHSLAISAKEKEIKKLEEETSEDAQKHAERISALKEQVKKDREALSTLEKNVTDTRAAMNENQKKIEQAESQINGGKEEKKFTIKHLKEEEIKAFNNYIDLIDQAIQLRQQTMTDLGAVLRDAPEDAEKANERMKVLKVTSNIFLPPYVEKLHKAYTSAVNNELKRLNNNPKYKKLHLSDLEKVQTPAPATQAPAFTHQRSSSTAESSRRQSATSPHRRSSSATESAHIRLSLNTQTRSSDSMSTATKKDEKGQTPGKTT